MKTNYKTILTGLLSVLISTTALATETHTAESTPLTSATSNFTPKLTNTLEVANYFHRLLPTTTISSIYTTPYPDTYALVIGSGVLYGNLHSSYLMVGHLFNVYTRDDITANLEQVNTPKVDISKINLADAIVVKSVNKVHKKLVVFVDPDCPYCRQLELQIEQQQLLQKADIYYMLMPLPMHPNAKAHTTNILCSTTPINTLHDYMGKNNEQPAVKLLAGCNIDPVLQRIGSISRSLSINGTPAIITGDGDLIMGDDIQAINNYLNAPSKH